MSQALRCWELTQQKTKKEKSKMRLEGTIQNKHGRFVTPSDFDRNELAQIAKKAVSLHAGVQTNVAFKYTCPECGERNFCASQNVMPAQVQCDACGNISPFTRGGFALQYALNPQAKGPPNILVALPPDMMRNERETQVNASRVTNAFGHGRGFRSHYTSPERKRNRAAENE